MKRLISEIAVMMLMVGVAAAAPLDKPAHPKDVKSAKAEQPDGKAIGKNEKKAIK